MENQHQHWLSPGAALEAGPSSMKKHRSTIIIFSVRQLYLVMKITAVLQLFEFNNGHQELLHFINFILLKMVPSNR
jgi:hypothetical protein